VRPWIGQICFLTFFNILLYDWYISRASDSLLLMSYQHREAVALWNEFRYLWFELTYVLRPGDLQISSWPQMVDEET
jgi:hypothetical protein